MLNRRHVRARPLSETGHQAAGARRGFLLVFFGSSILEPTREIRKQSSFFMVPIVIKCRKGL